MSDYRDKYRLEPTPLGIGGQAEVMRAHHKLTGDVVALKRKRATSPVYADRMRREIQVQSVIQHPNVMPILDFDSDDHEWFTMPLAEMSLADGSIPMSTGTLTDVLSASALGLQAAHALGFIHRDIKPSNILRINDAHGSRWVVADWGIVRRTDGTTTAKNTIAGSLLGTEGFAPPEAYSDSHDASFAWDSYSIGRVAAWAATGTWPKPLNDLAAPEPWRRFVRVLTDINASKRPQNMARVLEQLSLVLTPLSTTPSISNETMAAAKAGDPSASLVVLKAAQDYSDDSDFFIDDVSELLGPGLDSFVAEDPSGASRLVELMSAHLDKADWGHRDFDHYNVPLHWMQRVAEAAASSGALDLLDDACAALFASEPGYDRWSQARRSRAWLASLSGEAASRVAYLLREHPAAASYYGKLGKLDHAADPNIRAALKAALSSRD